MAQSFVCIVCRGGGRQAADEFCFEDVELECVDWCAYLGNMLNATDGVEQAVASWVRAVWMKFRELGGILCTQGASLRMKGVVYKACSQHVDEYGRDLGDESRGVSEAAERMLIMVCGVTLNDKM